MPSFGSDEARGADSIFEEGWVRGTLFWRQTSVDDPRELYFAGAQSASQRRGKELLARLLRQAGITKDEWEELN